MKNRVLYFTIGILLFCLSVVLYFRYDSSKFDRERFQAILSIPDFRLNMLNYTEVNLRDLTSNSDVLVFYFSTDCSYCDEEVLDLVERVGDFDNTYLIFVSANNPAEIQTFIDRNNLNGINRLTWLYDVDKAFSGNIGPMTVPIVFHYAPSRELVHVFEGKTSINELKKALSN